MNLRKRNAFTLIELVAVLVIMAIIALIVTPLVMSIIRKAKVSADKRSIDAYGRSIELAIAGYLMDNGSFPTSIEQLTIEYSGDEVLCSTTQLNSDSSVYLAGCTVGGRSTGDYNYGKEEEVTYDYKAGEEVTYNGVNYRILKDVKSTDNTVTLLKAEPLSNDEISRYISGGALTNNDCMQYGQTNDYSTSYVKQVVDAWKSAKVPQATETRLITIDELTSALGYELIDNGSVIYAPINKNVPDWVYSSEYSYWINGAYNDSNSEVWFLHSDGSIYVNNVHEYKSVRPVIVLPKSAL